MFAFGVTLTKNKDVVVEDNLAVDVFDENVEYLSSTMNIFIPAKIRDNVEINVNGGMRYWPNLSL